MRKILLNSTATNFLLSILAISLLTGCGSETESYSGLNIIADAPVQTKEIYISELSAGNAHSTMDPDFYAFSDWIELHNNTNMTMDVSGLHLSDDPQKPQKWQIPEGTLVAPHKYLIIWADKKDTKANALHTNFKLSQKGETVTLSHRTGEMIDSITYKELESDVSVTTTKGSTVYMSPTPNKTNKELYTRQLLSNLPTFSLKSGFYDTPHELTLTQNGEGTIYYTTDGSTPTKESSTYKQPLQITTSTVVRAMALEDERLPSKVATETYFVGFENLLPVVSLSTDEKYLFDSMVGIYPEGENGILLPHCGVRDSVPKNYAQDWRRPVHFTYFNQEKSKQFSLDLEFGIAGECSRNQDKKSFKFELDKKYGTKSLEYALYHDKGSLTLKDFKLRGSQEGSYISDVFAAQLVKEGNLDIDYQAHRAVETFINGEYWGLYNLREKKGKDYLKSNYPNIDEDNIDIIVNGREAKDGSFDDYNALKSYLQSHNYNLSNSTHYNEVASKVDIDGFIDYMSFMIYSANDDWLASNHRCWKEKKAGGKWRWMLDDLDIAYKHWNVNIHNYFEIAKGNDEGGNTQLLMTQLFKALNTNASFKQQFKSRFTHLLDTIFMPANMLSIYNKLFDERINVTKRAHRWYTEEYSLRDTVKNIPLFVNQRRDIVKGQLSSF